MAQHDPPPHILIVDDAPQILTLLRALLEPQGYRVTTARSLLTLDQVTALAPDVIIQDLLVAGTPAPTWRFLAQCRRDERLIPIPIVLCTAAVLTVTNPPIAAQLAQLGVRVVHKPFGTEAFLGMLKVVLATSSPRAPAAHRPR